jgi:hypothetical protein
VRSIQAIIYEAYLQAEPFHNQKNLTVLADRQLEVILRNSSPHHDEVHNWGMGFAKSNKLNYEQTLKKSKSKKRRILAFFVMMIPKMEKIFFSISVHGSSNVPLINVYQASIVAGTLKSITPGMFKRVINFFKRLRKNFQNE